MEHSEEATLSEVIVRLSREHAASRHEKVVELFHRASMGLIHQPTSLIAAGRMALDSATQLSSVGDLIQINQILGIAEQTAGDNERATRHLRRALRLSRQRGHLDGQARALAVLGQLAKSGGGFERGRRYLTSALDLYRSAGNARGEAQALGDLGNLADDSGNLELALSYYVRALAIFTALGDWESIAKVHHDAGVAVREQASSDSVAHGLLAVAARLRAGDEAGKEEAYWTLASWLVETNMSMPSDLPMLDTWFDTTQASLAASLTGELRTRVGLRSLASFDSAVWKTQVDLISEPAAQGLLRNAAEQLLAAGEPVAALEFLAVASTIERAQSIGPAEAAKEELALRQRLSGAASVAQLDDHIDLGRALNGEVELAALEALVQEVQDRIVEGVLRTLMGRRILSEWRTGDNAAAALDDGILQLEDAARTLGPDAGAMWWLEALADLGSAYRHRLHGSRQENHKRAIGWLRRADAAPLRPETVMGHLACMTNLSNALLFAESVDHNENVAEAIRLLERAIMFARQSPDMLGRVYTNLALAHVMRQDGDLVQNQEQARELYDLALGITNEPSVMAHAHHNLGLLYSRRLAGDSTDNVEASLHHLDQAQGIFDAMRWSYMAAEVRQTRAMAIASLTKGDPLANVDYAIAETELAIAAMESLERSYDAAGARNNLGNLRLQRADLVDPRLAKEDLLSAGRELESALTWRLQHALPREAAQSAHNLGNVRRRLFIEGEADELPAAIRLYRQALRVRELDVFPADWAQTSRALAVALLDSGRTDDAASAMAILNAIVDTGEARVGAADVQEAWGSLGDLAAEAQDWMRAAACYRKALEVADSRLFAAVLPGTSLREGHAILPLYYGLANAQARSGQPLECVLTLERSRGRFFSEAIERTRRDVRWLAAANPGLHRRYIDAAALVRGLVRLEAGDLRSEPSPYSADPRGRARFADLAEARERLRTIEEEIRSVPELPGVLGALGGDDLRSLVQARGPVLYISLLGARLAVAVCWAHDDALSVKVMFGPEDTTAALLDRLLLPGSPLPAPGSRTTFLLAHVGQADWSEVDIDAMCEELGRALPADLWAWLAREKPGRITLIACGPLALAPLHAAVIPGTTGVRVVDNCAVGYAPSARTLASLSPIDNLSPYIAFIGDPTGDLPEARKEATELSARFPVGPLWLGSEAVRGRILDGLRSAEVLHFAGHGSFDPDRPLDSGLYAADGLLTLRDVSEAAAAETRISRLVTLSACETAVTDILGFADEAIGLPNAFLLAGADGVIASLWPVLDDATAELMRYIYDGLADGMSPVEALQAAQRQAHRAGVRPAVEWAPFIYLGG